jgi:hypothetical protein
MMCHLQAFELSQQVETGLEGETSALYRPLYMLELDPGSDSIAVRAGMRSHREVQRCLLRKI